MQIFLRCEDLIDGEYVTTYVVGTGHEHGLQAKLVEKANKASNYITEEDITCIELIVTHPRIFIEGESRGSIAVNINNNKPLIWIGSKYESESSVTDENKILAIFKEWLEQE